jgi:glyoxylase-like metal-dependent hydrolase (beta-lactamase superfamily II)
VESLTARSQAAAKDLIDAAIAAVGGETALRGLASVRREFTEDWVDVGQGPRPWTGEPPAHALRPHAYSGEAAESSFIDYAGNRLHLWARFVDSPNDFGVFVDAVTPERAFQTFTYVREEPILMVRTREDGKALRRQHLRQHPEGLLRMALERPETLLLLGRSADDGAHHDLVALADSDGTQIVLYLDRRSHLPERAETRRGHRVYGDTTADVVYGDYRPTGGLVLPFAWTTRVAGVPVSRFKARSILVNAPADETWFRAPSTYVLAEAAPARLRVEPLGHGLYLIRGSYNLTFAEFRDHVLMIEAPAGESYMEEALALIEATVPGKPIRVVATHFHFDHIGGVRTAVARGLPVITTPDAGPVIERSLASRQAMRPDALARAQREVRVEIVAAGKVVDDGSQRVELYDFGPAPHVAQVLVAYYPRQRLLHVGDLFDTLTAERVFAGTDAEVMAARIREFGLDVERIVPTHGVPVTMRHLVAALEIRRQYREGTR